MRIAPETTMPRRAYSYLRISSSQQLAGDGLRRQGTFAEEICREEGWTLDDSMRLVDKGVSAFHGANADVGALGYFLNAIKSGRVTPGSVLIIESLDRLTREVVDEAYDRFRAILKAGVWIATREPRRLYTLESSGNMLALLEPLFIMARGHEESKIKSVRISAAWDAKQKLARTGGVAVSTKGPAWLRRSGGRWEVIPSRAATVAKVYAMAIGGMGAQRITAWLREHADECPAFGDCGVWTQSYVQRILRGRAAVGDYQPRKSSGGRMRPDGDAVPGYYPAVVSEDDWQRVQAAMDGRRRKSGRAGKSEANLFTAIVHDARTREPLSLHSARRKGGPAYCYLSAYRLGASHSGRTNLPYRVFEGAVLRAVQNLDPRELLRAGEVDDREVEIQTLTARLMSLDSRLRQLQESVSAPDSKVDELAPILDIIRQVAAHKAETVKALNARKLEARTGRTEVLGEVQSLLEILRDTEGTKEEGEMRLRVKSSLRWLIEEVWMVVQPVSRTARIAHLQIYLRGGSRQYVRVIHKLGGRKVASWDLRGADFRSPDFRIDDLGNIGRVAGEAS